MARIDTDLLGLQIIALDSATVVGEIDGLLIDDAAMKVAGFLVDTGLYEASTLRFESAHAVGLDAVIVESADKITEISADPVLEALAEKDVAISDAKAITRSGRSVGIIGDFFIDTETGDVVGMVFLAADQTVYPREAAVIPVSVVYRLGRDIVVLEDDYDRHLMKDEASLGRVAQPPATESASPEPAAVEPEETPAATVGTEDATDTATTDADATNADANDADATEEAAIEESATEEPEAEGEGATAMAFAPTVTEPDAPSDDPFASEQRHFLIGKRVLRRIETPGGEIIAEEGDLVTPEMIQMAKDSDQLLILSLNVE
ncbi:MAG: PRC-barrel domain-containing protein [Thermoleophilia bacterium]